ncbi:MAG: type II toxin-antitoxin system prevent-host-death family antitoxin [Chloroflexota bacterium]|nr:type II toxin-antitoxin system prevent-host-death family antitoxin [Chloroflexota bacterium]
MTQTDLARRTREILERVLRRNARAVITRHGRPEAAIVDIDELHALVADRERLRQLERDEPLIQQVTTHCDVNREAARLRIAEARQNVYTLVEQAHERNPDIPPEVIDTLVEEARSRQ